MKLILLIVATVAVMTLSSCDTATNSAGGDVVLGNDFTQKDINGKTVSLSDFRGKIVLVDFWASWCGPCRAHTPFLKELWAKYRDDDFMLIGVSLDFNLDDWRGYISDNELTWTQLSDGKYFDNVVARQYDVRSIPTFMIFDRDGNRIGDTWTFQNMEEQIIKALEAE